MMPLQLYLYNFCYITHHIYTAHLILRKKEILCLIWPANRIYTSCIRILQHIINYLQPRTQTRKAEK